MSGILRGGFPPLTPGVRRLLLVLAGVFVAQLIASAALGYDAGAYGRIVNGFLALDLRGVLRGYVWQPLTYMVMHSLDSWGHLLSNAIGLYFLGSAIEERMGARSLTRLAIGSGLAGAAAVLVVQGVGLATGRWTPIPVVGASGAVSGIAGAFCYLFWDRWLYLFFIRLQGKHLLALFLLIELVRGAQGVMGTSNVAVHCHLGGLAWGLLWVRGWSNPKTAWLSFRHWRAKRKLRVVYDRDADEKPTWLN